MKVLALAQSPAFTMLSIVRPLPIPVEVVTDLVDPPDPDWLDIVMTDFNHLQTVAGETVLCGLLTETNKVSFFLSSFDLKM